MGKEKFLCNADDQLMHKWLVDFKEFLPIGQKITDLSF